MSRPPRPWKLPDKELARIVRESFARCNRAKEALRDFAAELKHGRVPRVAGERVTEGTLHEMLGPLLAARHSYAADLVCRAFLETPLVSKADRKGALPSTLQLNDRGERGRAIWLAMDAMLETPMRDPGAQCAAGQCASRQTLRPRQSPRAELPVERGPCPPGDCRRTFVFPKDATEAAQAVVEGFYAAGIDRKLNRKLEVGAVLKIWQRGWKSMGLESGSRTSREP